MIAGHIPGRTATAPLAVFVAVEAGERREALILSAALLAISLAAITLLGRLHRATK